MSINSIFEYFAPQKSKGLDREESLNAIPVVNSGVKIIEERKDGIVLSVLVKRGDGFFSKFQPPVMLKQLELDMLGMYVFKLIDGKNTAMDIINSFVKEFKVNRREAELSCVEFLKSLIRRHVISIVVPKK